METYHKKAVGLALALVATLLVLAIYLSFSISTAGPVFASTTDGTVSTASTSRYAYMESGSWIDFGTTFGDVHVTDSALTGYAWSAEFGWISLNCSNTSSCTTVDYSVVNDGNGVLSGYSWSESAGWIDWKPTYGGVTIDSSGVFNGRAWSDQTGWITFNCSTDTSCDGVDYRVVTDWRPVSSRASTIVASVGNTVLSSSSGSKTWYYYILRPISIAKNTVAGIAEKIGDVLSGVLSNEPKTVLPVVEEVITKLSPLSMMGKWNLLPVDKINEFALAPLPGSVRMLVEKFPELAKTFKAVGISKMSDLNRLSGGKFVLSGISKEAGIAGGASVPIASLTASQKKVLPSDIVFAKAGSLIDYSIFLTIDNDGTANQKIATIVGKPVELAVKVDKPATSVKGYLTIKNLDRRSASRSVPVTSLLAAPIMATLALGNTSNAIDEDTGESDIQTEDKLVLQRFDYADPDNDGIYTASINAPMVHGEYEIISVIDYRDKSLGKKELRLIAVVDPEGYVYEPNGNKETRIPDAKVTLFIKDPQHGEFTVWSAKDYQQVNPQRTDKSGTYSFLVPEGLYKLTVSAPGYYDYEGEEFTVQEGHNVHENIAVKAKSWWRTLFGLH